MFCNSGCNCNPGCGCGNNGGMNGCKAAPIIAPKKVCTSCSNQYVEQPIICPIECRHINNVVYYPRYYPRYEQTYMTQSSPNPYASGSYYGNNAGFTANGAGSTVINGTACNGNNSCGCRR